MKLNIAVLIDGAFFLKRYNKVVPNGRYHSPKQVVDNLFRFSLGHIGENNLYRILYYDCAPLGKRVHNPITNKIINFETSEQTQFRLNIFHELKRKRKVALRLGNIASSGNWLIYPEQTKRLLNGSLKISELKDTDVFYEMRQKGVDIKIGVDIASLAFKKLVDRIVLISGDGDFVPAAKLARREGIDFMLDPMWNNINGELFEHIDGLMSTCPRPIFKHKSVPTSKTPTTTIPVR